MKPVAAMIFSNGNVAVFDDTGEQIGELQESWMRLWFNHLITNGVTPDQLKTMTITTYVNGRNCYIKPFEVEGGWNWQVIDKV